MSHPEFVTLLARCDQIYAALDADSAGQDATARLIGSLGPRGEHACRDPCQSCHRPTTCCLVSIAESGPDRIGTDAGLCLAFLRHSGLRL
jgi:Toprim-like